VRQRVWTWARLSAGAAILAVLVWRLGTGPFLAGLRTINAASLAAAAVLGVVTTTGAALRWRLVARELGVGMPVRAAVAACYRAQFLNAALPAGVLGDVHRAVRHGRDVGDVGRAARTVVWERCAGQVVQIALALAVLVVLPSPVRAALVVILPAVALIALAVVVVVRARLPQGSVRWARVVRTARADIRTGLVSRRTWPTIVVVSAIVVAGHTATFLIAARTAGTTASLAQLLPITMIVLLAMSVPTNVGGWGPREGACAWLFGAVGLGAAQGIAVATVYGVLSLVATLPGAAVLIGTWHRSQNGQDSVEDAAEPERVPEGAGAVRG
jgi:glycosyltransferase 2 family protein